MWKFGNMNVVVTDIRNRSNIRSAVLIPLNASGSIVHYFGYGGDTLTIRMLFAGVNKLNQFENIIHSGNSVLLYGPVDNPVFSGNIFVTSYNIDQNTVVCQTFDRDNPNSNMVYSVTVEAIQL